MLLGTFGLASTTQICMSSDGLCYLGIDHVHTIKACTILIWTLS